MHPVRDRGILDPDGRRWSVLVGTILAVGALVPIANANARSLPFDDAYISFSYAARLVAGHGLRLSVGSPPVEAFSDPLWVAILAIGKLVGVTIPTWARVVNIVLVGVLGATTARLVRRLNPDAPAWMAVGAATLVVFVPATAYDAVAGLETLLFAALVNLVLLVFLDDWTEHRTLSAATTVGCLLLAVTRPEGALVWAVLWAQTWVWDRSVRNQLRSASGFVLPMAGLELARLAYFGQLLPNSIVAKAGQSPEVTKQLVRAEALRFGTAYLPVLCLAGLAVVAILADRRWRTPITALLPVVVVLGLVEVALSAGDNYPYERYLLPLLAPLAAIAVAGVSLMAWDRQSARVERHGGALRAGCALLVVAVLAGTFVTAYRHRQPGTTTGDALAVGRGLSRIPHLFAQDTLDDHGDNYQYGVAKILDRIGHPHQVIATDEVGAVSYYTDLRVLDLYGLADSHIAHRPGPPGSRVDPAYVYAQQPAFFSFRLGGSCLCAGIGDDLAYTGDPQIFAYRLVAFVPEVIPDYHSVPPAALLQRDASITGVTSLDGQIPPAARAIGDFSGPVDPLLIPDPNTRVTTRPTPVQVAAAPLALRGTFTTVVPSTDVPLALPTPTGSRCEVEVTAIRGAGESPTMSLAITDQGDRSIARATSESSAPNVETVTIDIPSGAVDPVLHLDMTPPPIGTVAAQWAEPRMICRSNPPR